MNNNIASVCIFAVIFITSSVIISTISNYRLKKRMVESGTIDENSIKLLTQSLLDFKFSVLKWGIVLLFGGAGLMALEFIPYSFENSPFPYGFEGFVLALGLLVYYLILRKEKQA